MAYGIKYRFTFESIHGITTTVNLLEDGYSGTVKNRPLGKAPVIRMQESDPFRATSCNLSLECQVDGEFTSLYTSDPKKYRIDVYRGNTLVWTGFIATEIYAEPHIAPPYDVAVTATDGLGTLKEYDFPARGLKKVRDHISYFLSQTGLERNQYVCMTSGPTSGTPLTFLDSVSIDMDYMVGESCYDVFAELLRSMHLTVTMYSGNWLLVRETDLESKLSSGSLSVYSIPARGSTSPTSTTTLSNVGKTIGKMGVAAVWPVGYLTRRAVPAKNSVTIEAPWHPVSPAPSVAGDGWTHGNNVTFVSSPGYYLLSSSWGIFGNIYTDIPLSCMCADMSVSVSYSTDSAGDSVWPLTISVTYAETGGDTYYYDRENGWNTTRGTIQELVDRNVLNTAHDPSLTQKMTFTIPALPSVNAGTLHIDVSSTKLDVYDIGIDVLMNKGYKDTITIDNGARGSDGTYTITGGRATYGELPSTDFYNGLFVWTDYPDTAVFDWADNRRYGCDFMSLTALDYALSVALPRVELTGKFDMPSTLTFLPFVLSLQGVNYQMKTYDWDMLNEDVNFTAISTPAASLTVDSETVTTIDPNATAYGTTSSGSGGSGGGGGGGSYTLPIASDSVLGGIKVGSGLSINSTTGVLSATSGGSGTVTKVAMTVPTGLSVSGSPITSSGTLAVSLASGYSIPTTAKQVNWDSAYDAMHSHSNKSVLDGITSQDVSNWDAAVAAGGQVDVSIGGTAAAPTVAVAIGSNNSDSAALPVASASAAGIVSTGAQVFSGNKTFDRIYLGNSATYGMYIEWDNTNHMFKIVGDAYVTGDIAAGGVS